VNILQAMADPVLFGKHFWKPWKAHFSGNSWGSWQVFLGALFGLPLSDDQLALFRLCTGRQTAPTASFGEIAAIICPATIRMDVGPLTWRKSWWSTRASRTIRSYNERAGR
jgi:hypothetical protein